MVRKKLLYLIATLCLMYEVYSLELLANYQFWKTVSDTLAYDFSGNARHVSFLSNNFLATTRGVSPYDSLQSNIMHYHMPSTDEYNISFWMLNHAEECSFYLNLSRLTDSTVISYKINSALQFELEFRYESTCLDCPIIPTIFTGWNLHTLRIYFDSTTAYIETYLNLSLLRSASTAIAANSNAFMISLTSTDFMSNTGLTIYEMWVHKGLVNISDLNYLISSPSICGCSYNCPTSPSTICLPIYSKIMNSLGNVCSPSCLTVKQSCTSNSVSVCLPKTESSCYYSLFDKQVYECIFFCPGNSCSCTTSFNAPTFTFLFTCSCMTGYRMVSSNPLACLSNHCLTYHRVGYSYICDTISLGYALNSVGQCCVCASGYTQKTASPLTCVNLSKCLTLDPLVPNACLTCSVGYAVDPNKGCDLCAANYVNVSTSPFICTLAIEHCISYVYSANIWICQTCDVGYQVDSAGSCNECGSGYFVSNYTPFTSISKIQNCESQSFDGLNWICEACNEGFGISESRLECNLLVPESIPKCLAYVLIEGSFLCSACLQGYQIDNDGKCDLCDVNYVELSQDTFTCIPKIDNCSAYKQVGVDYICQKCNIGYKLGNSGLCNECDTDYVKLYSGTLYCEPSIPYCLEYDVNKEALICTKCEIGYIIDPDYKCTICDVGYKQLSHESAICILEKYHCSQYGFYENKWVCIKCDAGYEANSDMECNLCAAGYSSYPSQPITCIPEPDSNNLNSNSDSEEETQDISKETKNLGEKIVLSNSIISATTIAAASVSSIVSKDSNYIILCVSTIQLISYIQYLNINLPYAIKKQQSSTFKYIKKINLFSYITMQDRELDDYLEYSLDDDHGFLSQTVYYLVLILLLLIVNFVIYYINWCGKGKLKALGGKTLIYFKYSIYIQIFMVTYLDLAYSCLSKMMNVRYT